MTKSVCLSSLVCLLLLSLVGCSEPQQKEQKSRFDLYPSASYLVGGGYLLDYVALMDGTILVLDTSSSKYLLTKSIKKGDKFELEIDPEFLKTYGLDSEQVNIKLFLVPEGYNRINQ